VPACVQRPQAGYRDRPAPRAGSRDRPAGDRRGGRGSGTDPGQQHRAADHGDRPRAMPGRMRDYAHGTHPPDSIAGVQDGHALKTPSQAIRMATGQHQLWRFRVALIIRSIMRPGRSDLNQPGTRPRNVASRGDYSRWSGPPVPGTAAPSRPLLCESRAAAHACRRSR
jgi:hypothetical protein